MEPSSAELGKGARQQFTATGSDKHGNVISDLAFLWETTGGDIGQDGLFTASGAPGSYHVGVSATFEGSTAIGSATVEVLAKLDLQNASFSASSSHESHPFRYAFDGRVDTWWGAGASPP